MSTFVALCQKQRCCRAAIRMSRPRDANGALIPFSQLHRDAAGNLISLQKQPRDSDGRYVPFTDGNPRPPSSSREEAFLAGGVNLTAPTATRPPPHPSSRLQNVHAALPRDASGNLLPPPGSQPPRPQPNSRLQGALASLPRNAKGNLLPPPGGRYPVPTRSPIPLDASASGSTLVGPSRPPRQIRDLGATLANLAPLQPLMRAAPGPAPATSSNPAAVGNTGLRLQSSRPRGSDSSSSSDGSDPKSKLTS